MNYLKLWGVVLMLFTLSCGLFDSTPYSNFEEFTVWAVEDNNLVDSLDTSGIWEDSITGFDTSYVCNFVTSAHAVYVLQHPLFPTKEIVLGVYEANIIYSEYEEVIPGFKDGTQVITRFKSWEPTSIQQGCAPGGNVWCTVPALPPVSDGNHPWTPNDNTNWLLIMSNPDCECPYTPAEDPLGIKCEWRN